MVVDRIWVSGYYRPQRSCGQGNIFTPVCHSFCSQGGGGLPQCMLGYHHPPGPGRPPQTRQTPPDQADPPGPGRCPPRPGRHPPPRPGRPPLDQADTPLDQANPPGSRLQHMVYERPVRILLECILVLVRDFCETKHFPNYYILLRVVTEEGASGLL